MSARPDSFANHVYPDWETAMHQFFNAVDRKRRHRNLTGKQVHAELVRGYGDDVADDWAEWYGDGDEDDQ